MLSFRLGRALSLMALVLALGLGASVLEPEVSGAQTQQQQQKKKKNKNKNQQLPPQFQLPPTALPPNPPATDNKTTGNGKDSSTPSSKTVEKEVEYAVAEDAQVQKLQKFDTGLNFVEAKGSELKEGQRVTLSLVAKTDTEKKNVEHVSGTIIKIADKVEKITLRVTLPEKQDVPDPANKQAALVSIRSLPDNKDK